MSQHSHELLPNEANETKCDMGMVTSILVFNDRCHGYHPYDARSFGL